MALKAKCDAIVASTKALRASPPSCGKQRSQWRFDEFIWERVRAAALEIHQPQQIINENEVMSELNGPGGGGERRVARGKPSKWTRAHF